jgi:hypothetical protein
VQDMKPGGYHTISHLAGADMPGSPMHCAVVSGSSDGTVRLFDLRCGHKGTGPDLKFCSHHAPFTGLAMRTTGILATASQGAVHTEMHFTDIRMASDAPITCAAAHGMLYSRCLPSMSGR